MAVYYQPVLDAIAIQAHPSLERVRKLCEAVDAEDRGRIALLTGPFVKSEVALHPPIEDLPQELFHETMARLLMMGAHQDLQLLLEWYQPLTIGSRTSGREVGNLVGMFTFVPVPQANLNEKELDRLLKRIAVALGYVLPAYSLAVANAPPPSSPTSLNEVSAGSFGTISFGSRTRVSVLEDGIRALAAAWMAVHQQFLDAALVQFGAGGARRGEKLLALRDRWMQMLRLTVLKQPQTSRLARVAVPLARIKYGRSPHHTYQDAFEPFDARTFGFRPYDRKPQDEPTGKTIWLWDLLRLRGAQIHFLLDEFGEYYPPLEPPRTPSAQQEEKQRVARYAERRKLIDQVGRHTKSLNLVSEDDIVDFGCAYFQAVLVSMTTQSTDDARVRAWDLLIEFLAGYLRTETAHTDFNLDEEPMYFDRLFPRSIGGAVLHDCGVYAVRLAYILLSLADCMKTAQAGSAKPMVHFVFLPLHVGLIVQIEQLAPIIIHNALVLRFTPDQAKDWRTEWESVPDTSGPDPVSPAAREVKFREDLAAQLFLPDVDLPLFTVPIAPVSAPPKKQQIWKVYRAGVKRIGGMFAARVESAGSADFEFDLKFLNVMDLEKRWHDSNVVPFWNEQCFGLWNQKDRSNNRLYTVARLKNNPSLRTRYADSLEKLVELVDESYEKEVRPEKDKLTKEFRAKPKLIGPATQRVTTANRLRQSARGIGPVGVVRQHIDDVRKGNVSEPPFAEEARFLSRTGD